MTLTKRTSRKMALAFATVSSLCAVASTSANEFITSTGSNNIVTLANESAWKAQVDTGALLSGAVGDYVILFIIWATISAALGLFYFRK